MVLALRSGMPLLAWWMPWIATAATIGDFGARLAANRNAFATQSPASSGRR
jgi:hypothetical protein